MFDLPEWLIQAGAGTFNTNIKIIAHRGASFDAPENTLASVNLAWEQNIHFVEVDVKLTLDNILVVFHDETTVRFNQINKPVSKYNFEELLESSPSV